MQLTHDPLIFEHTTLVNGVRTYHCGHSVDFTELTVRFPFGSGHNVSPIIPGSFHFLEHSLFLGSKLHPQPQQYQKLVEGAGGSLNAITYPEYTDYSLSLPTSDLATLLPGFFSMLFEPLFLEKELVREQSVVATERKRAERWFPSTNELGNFLYTKWCNTSPLSLRTRLGSDEDLAQMSSSYLRQLHAHYLTTKLQVVSVGGNRPDVFLDLLSGLSLTDQVLPIELIAPHWVDRSFREVAFRDLSRPEYFWEGLVPQKPSRADYRAFSIGLDYLFNNGNGAIYTWLRDELGRIYDISYGATRDYGYLSWDVRIPMSEVGHIYELRQQLAGKIADSLADDAAIAGYVQQRLKAICYWYQTAEDIQEEALAQLDLFGHIYPSQSMIDLMQEAAQPGRVAAVWKQFVLDQPDTQGEVILLPKDEEEDGL